MSSTINFDLAVGEHGSEYLGTLKGDVHHLPRTGERIALRGEVYRVKEVTHDYPLGERSGPVGEIWVTLTLVNGGDDDE